MRSWSVVCGSCSVNWPRVGQFSDYERESIESRPCPGCGLYTLTCRETFTRRRNRDRVASGPLSGVHVRKAG